VTTDNESTVSGPPRQRIPTLLLIAIIAAVLVLVSAIALWLSNSRHETAAQPASSGSSTTRSSVLDNVGCLSPQPWPTDSSDVGTEYRCTGVVTSTSDQSFVYFFTTAGQESAWLSRVQSYNTGVPIVLGPGWAVSTTHAEQISAAVNAGGQRVG